MLVSLRLDGLPLSLSKEAGSKSEVRQENKKSDNNVVSIVPAVNARVQKRHGSRLVCRLQCLKLGPPNGRRFWDRMWTWRLVGVLRWWWGAVLSDQFEQVFIGHLLVTKPMYLGTLSQLVSIPQPPEPRVQRTGAHAILSVRAKPTSVR